MPIDERNLLAARVAWGEGLLAISDAYETGGIVRAKQIASAFIDTVYGYDLGPVLFKPTRSGGEQTFRTTKNGALSYFVGHDKNYPLDRGFGIMRWRSVTSKTAACYINGDIAMWMGWFLMKDKDDEVTKVDKSFGYKKSPDGVLKIVLHHSSFPYGS